MFVFGTGSEIVGHMHIESPFPHLPSTGNLGEFYPTKFYFKAHDFGVETQNELWLHEIVRILRTLLLLK